MELTSDVVTFSGPGCTVDVKGRGARLNIAPEVEKDKDAEEQEMKR